MPRQESKRAARDNAALKTMFKDDNPTKSDGTPVNDAALNRAAGRVDQQAIIDEADSELITEEWDRTSPINGVDARTVLRSRSDIPPLPAKVYLVKHAGTGKVIMFQPFKPGLGGRQSIVDQAEFDDIKDDHRQKMVNARADQRIKRALMAELDKE